MRKLLHSTLCEVPSNLLLKVATNLVTLQTCLTSMMGRPITMDQLRQDVGNMVEKVTKVITSLRNFRLTIQEYVCLKVVAMLTEDGKFYNSKIFFLLKIWKSFLT